MNMGEQKSPRSRVKALLKGETPASPLVLPIVFALGSRLENVSLAEFMKNPTKIANALRQIRATLNVDGVCCYFDPFLEAEALGSRLQWTTYGPQLASVPNVSEIQKKLGPVDQIVSAGRVGIAAEVIKRAKIMLRDEPALMVRVTGPLTLASQLAAGRRDELEHDLVEFCAEISSALTKAYLEAGADVVLLTESSFPTVTAQLRDSWRSLLCPVINMVRFYEALPILVLADERLSREDLALISSGSWDCVVCPRVSAFQVLRGEGWNVSGVSGGLAITPDAFAAGHAPRGWPGDGQTVLLTTSEDIPVDADLKRLAAVSQELRGTMAA